MRWAGHVVRTRDRRGAYRVLIGRPYGKGPLGRLGLDGRIILKLSFKKCYGEEWNGLIWLRMKHYGKKKLGKTRRRWEDNIKTYLKEVLWGGMDWIALAQDKD
jgi:hypothetical protein